MEVKLKDLSKYFGKVKAVNDFNLEINDGEFVALLGPSGCGKTTTLLMIAGIYKPTAGGIYFGDKIVNEVLPKDRKIGMVFQSIWLATLNTFLLATVMTTIVVFVSSMSAYALSRMKFAGRKGFLSATLILHAFPSVTLLIPIYFILRWITKIPIIGKGLPFIGGFGFNTIGGVALVMVAFQLPFGIWIMKGFFDNISWDMERSALIDGASRFQVWWEILMPNIKPGIAALSIFAFISGWNAYLIPFTFIVGRAGKITVLSAYVQNFMSESVMTEWNMVAAVGLFQLIPVLIFFFFTQEALLNIYGGGAKGGA